MPFVSTRTELEDCSQDGEPQVVVAISSGWVVVIAPGGDGAHAPASQMCLMRWKDAELVRDAAYGPQHFEVVVLGVSAIVSVEQLVVMLAESVRDVLCFRVLNRARHSEPSVGVLVGVEGVANLNVVTHVVDPSAMSADLITVGIAARHASHSLATGARQGLLRRGMRHAMATRAVQSSARDGGVNSPTRELSR
jgi:hypothetical protein